MSSDEIHYRLLKLLEDRPELSQRELSRILGVSLGKTNYCVRALMAKGWIKARNFKNSRNKMAYAYLLTPQGIRAKTRVAQQFLERKKVEYEALKKEIEDLQADLEKAR